MKTVVYRNKKIDLFIFALMNDLKYLMAYTIPMSALFGILLLDWYSYITIIYVFVFIPLIEAIFSTNKTRFSKEEKNNRLKNKIFDWFLYLNVPIVFGILFLSLYTLNNYSLETYELIGIILSTGLVLATNGINVAHELGHRRSRAEKTLSKILLLPCLYMHFFIEHNYGHHKNVATPDDPASAKKNQNLYSFWATSVIGQYIGAWKIQSEMLKRKKLSILSFENDMLYYSIFQFLYLCFLGILFGWSTSIYAICIAVISFLVLETINYIEHYGLSRQKIDGKYEKIKNTHSWNSDHKIGRIVLYELTRHSDHHFISTKKYQVLETKDDSPQLKFGYPSSMILAMIPPAWFYFMNPKLSE